MISLQQPQSEGYVAVNANDPLQAPSIQPNYLSNPIDVKALLVGILIFIFEQMSDWLIP